VTLNQFRFWMGFSFIFLLGGCLYLFGQFPRQSDVIGTVLLVGGAALTWVYWAARPRNRRVRRQSTAQIHRRR
jgi:hypothetical protein